MKKILFVIFLVLFLSSIDIKNDYQSVDYSKYFSIENKVYDFAPQSLFYCKHRAWRFYFYFKHIKNNNYSLEITNNFFDKNYYIEFSISDKIIVNNIYKYKDGKRIKLQVNKSIFLDVNKLGSILSFTDGKSSYKIINKSNYFKEGNVIESYFNLYINNNKKYFKLRISSEKGFEFFIIEPNKYEIAHKYLLRRKLSYEYYEMLKAMYEETGYTIYYAPYELLIEYEVKYDVEE